MGRDVLCDMAGEAWPTLIAHQKPWAQPAPASSPTLARKMWATAAPPQPSKPSVDAGTPAGPALVVRNTFLDVEEVGDQPPVLRRARSCDAVIVSCGATDDECLASYGDESQASSSDECQVISSAPLQAVEKCRAQELEIPCTSNGCQTALAMVKPEPLKTGWLESDDCLPSPVHWPERACPEGWPTLSEGSMTSCAPQWTAFPVLGMLTAWPSPIPHWAPELSGAAPCPADWRQPGASDTCQQGEHVENEPLSGSTRRKRERRQRKNANALTAATCARHESDSTACRDMRFEDITARLAAGGEQQRGAIAQLRGNFVRAAFDAQGCRVAQAALDDASGEEQAQLASELRGCVLEAIESPHANFVVQKVVQVLPPALVQFVVEELAGVAAQTALHCFGCRVICRLLEHCPHQQTACLVDEVLGKGALLCKDTFGNHVIRHILEHGTPEQRRAVARVLLDDPLRLAGHRTASCVVEKALAHCASEDSGALAGALLRNGDTVAQLACGRYGSYVVRALLSHGQVDTAGARALLWQMSPTLQQSRFGQRLLEDLRGEGAEA